jgi:RNA polymerase sigma-70 factor (ECF subfamily)
MPQRGGAGDIPEQLRLLEVETYRTVSDPEAGHPPSDGELIARVGAGEEFAFETLYTRHSTWVRAVLMNLGRSLQDAEELAHDVFLDLRRAAVTQRIWVPPGGIRRWLARVAIRRHIDRYRSHRNDVATESLTTGSPEAPDVSFEQGIQAQDLTRHLRERVSSEIDRGAVVLKLVLMNKTQEAIASELGMTRDQVRGRLQKIREIATNLRTCGIRVKPKRGIQ